MIMICMVWKDQLWELNKYKKILLNLCFSYRKWTQCFVQNAMRKCVGCAYACSNFFEMNLQVFFVLLVCSFIIFCKMVKIGLWFIFQIHNFHDLIQKMFGPCFYMYSWFTCSSWNTQFLVFEVFLVLVIVNFQFWNW